MNINAEAEDSRWNLLYQGLLSNSLCRWLSLCNYIVYIYEEIESRPNPASSPMKVHLSSCSHWPHWGQWGARWGVGSATQNFLQDWGLNKLIFVTLGISITRIINISATTKKSYNLKKTNKQNQNKLSRVHLYTKL